MKRIRVYLCPTCGDQFQFAGFCDSCGTRLGAYSCIPVEAILRKRDEVVAQSSPLPAEFIRQFVDSLLVSQTTDAG